MTKKKQPQPQPAATGILIQHCNFSNKENDKLYDAAIAIAKAAEENAKTISNIATMLAAANDKAPLLSVTHGK